MNADGVFMFSRRKRGEKGEVVETIEDVIVRRLTAERIDELKRLLKDTQEKYRCLFCPFTLLSNFVLVLHF